MMKGHGWIGVTRDACRFSLRAPCTPANTHRVIPALAEFIDWSAVQAATLMIPPANVQRKCSSETGALR
jgi:hypothetical protein